MYIIMFHLLPLLFRVTLLIVVTEKIQADIYTSSSKIERLVNNEGAILEIFKPYLDKKRQELLELENFFSERQKVVHARNMLNDSFKADHPNSQYNVVKEYFHRYKNLRQYLADKLSDGYGDDPTRLYKQQVPLPSDEDLDGARLSLVDLQKIYQLNTSDMVKGNYSGYQGPPLGYEDAFEIGRAAFADSYIFQSIQWLVAAIEAKNKETTVIKQITSETALRSVSLLEIKALLARAYLYNGEKEKAFQIYREVKDVGSDLPDIEEFENEMDLEMEPASSVQEAGNEFNYEHVCRLGQRSTALPGNDRRLFCRYQPGYVPYYRFKEELLSISPFASVFYNFIMDHEADEILEMTKFSLERGMVMNYEGSGSRTSLSRTGELTWLEDNDLEAVSRLSDRIEQVTKLKVKSRLKKIPHTFSESLQVVNYGIGGQYKFHMDVLEKYAADNIGKYLAPTRLATFLMYLTDVPIGGATVFVNANLSVSPIKNMALFWYNYKPSMVIDEDSLHGGCPVVIGQKWIANKWILARGNEFSRLCGLHEDDSQLDVEPLMNVKRLTQFY